MGRSSARCARRSPSSGEMSSRIEARATARYIAPVSRNLYPRRSARRRPIVLLPAPAGPSMAMVLGTRARLSLVGSSWAWSPDRILLSWCVLWLLCALFILPTCFTLNRRNARRAEADRLLERVYLVGSQVAPLPLIERA